jgi:hypothetical protein
MPTTSASSRSASWAVLAFAVLTSLAACGPTTDATDTPPATDASTPGGSPPASSAPAPSVTAGTGSSPTAGGPTGSGGSGTAAAWPSPADCVSYDPTTVTVAYEAGVYQVTDGTTIVLKAAGSPSDDTGTKALALAQHYRRHCFLGRHNTREDQGAYIFDYWRDPTGVTTPIPGRDDDCSDYHPANLTVEDMGGGDGWRVKDHDHVLQLFDTGTDARNGARVLARYRSICFIGNGDDDTQSQISYLL